MLPNFRIWDKEEKYMKTTPQSVGYLVGEIITRQMMGRSDNVVKSDYGRYVVMMGTRVWDRKKKEIFEKDIIERYTKRLYIVEYKHGTFWLIDIIKPSNMIIPLSLCMHEPCEIIGNICENPELLKEANDDN